MKALFLVIFCVCFMASLQCSLGYRHAGWVYKEDQLDPNLVLATMRKYGISQLFLSVDTRKLNQKRTNFYDPAYEKKILALLNIVKQVPSSNVQLYTLQDINYITGVYDWRPHIMDLENFASRYPIPTYFQGVHFDLEPHQDPTWERSDADKLRLFTQFMNLLKNVGSYIRNSATLKNAELMIDVPHWFMGTTYGDATNFPYALQPFRYQFSFMIYGGTGTKIWHYANTEPEMKVIPSILGIGYTEFNNADLLIAFQKQLDAHYQNFGVNFLGTAVYEFNHLYAQVHSTRLQSEHKQLPQQLPQQQLPQQQLPQQQLPHQLPQQLQQNTAIDTLPLTQHTQTIASFVTEVNSGLQVLPLSAVYILIGICFVTLLLFV